MIKLGDKVTLDTLPGEVGEVVRVQGKYVDVKFPDGVYSKPVSFFSPVFQGPNGVQISPAFVNFLKIQSRNNEVHVRLHWGKDCDSQVQDFFRKEGLGVATAGIRPLESEQFALSGTVWFPEPPSFLMKEIQDLNLHPHSDKGVVEVHSAALAISLVKLGFVADRSARYGIRN